MVFPSALIFPSNPPPTPGIAIFTAWSRSVTELGGKGLRTLIDADHLGLQRIGFSG
jgi:hypothetical protein